MSTTQQTAGLSPQLSLELSMSTTQQTARQKHITSHTQSLNGLCPGLFGYAGTRRNIHPLTPILIIEHPLSTSSIYYDPQQSLWSVYVLDSPFPQPSSIFHQHIWLRCMALARQSAIRQFASTFPQSDCNVTVRVLNSVLLMWRKCTGCEDYLHQRTATARRIHSHTLNGRRQLHTTQPTTDAQLADRFMLQQ